ncbi:MAG: tRNA epoxyqueuosine(34) reductase QueG, partial [Calditrichaeota bacterium]
MSLTQAIKAQARELGFELVGVAPVEVVPELTFYKEWVEAGYAGKMAYMERNIEKRMDVRQVVPAAKSVIVCGMVYHTPQRLSTCSDSQRGWISRYAWGDDYHDVLKARLLHLAAFAENEVDGQMTWRAYVDTGPVVERVFAKYAGLGWFGKNTCLINQQEGSWFFIGEIITDVELEYDTPAPDRCGTCNRCIDACPTDAILEPYLLDARRCISYLTIELRETIPTPLRAGMGNHVFGCDICQDVCPWNRKARFTREESFHPRDGLVEPDLEELAG